MKTTTTTLLFSIMSSLTLSTAVLAEGFSDRSPDYTAISAEGRVSSHELAGQALYGFNDRGVNAMEAHAKDYVSSDNLELRLAERYGFNNRTPDWML